MQLRRTGRGGAALLVGAALAAALPQSGCVLLPLGGKPTAAPGGGLSPLGGGLRDFRVAFHCHSHLSHDSEVPFDEIARTARLLGFNAVILNDHYRAGNIARAPHGTWDGVLFVPGVEIRPGAVPPATGTSRRGALLVFGIERDFDRDAERVSLALELEAQGAVVAAGHCEEFDDWDPYPLQAFEVYNLHAQFKLASGWDIARRFIFFLPDRFFEAHIEPPRRVLEAYDRLLRKGRPLAPLAGHDAHANVRPFGRWGPTIGTYPEILRLFSNHVLAKSLDRESLLDAIRKGRTYISFDFLGDGSGFALSYGPAPGGGDGSGELAAPAILGDEARWRGDLVLRVEAPAEGIIRVLRDGAPWREASGRSFAEPVPGPGVYRAEVYRQGPSRTKRLWIISAPIRLRESG